MPLMLNKKTLLSVILVASFALLGLMAIQVFWIQNSLSIREENFRRGVNDACRQVVRQLEHIDALRLLEKGSEDELSDGRNMKAMDSLRQAFDEYLTDHPDVFNNPYREAEPEPASGEKPAGIPSLGPETQIALPETSSVESYMPDSIKQAAIQAFVRRKSSLLERALEDMLSGNEPMSSKNRLTEGLLDTLLRSELANRGIYAEFVFGVFNPIRNEFTVLSDPERKERILRSGMIFALFPSDMVVNPDYLMIHFPEQRHYLLTNMWGLLAISVLLLLIIILSFIYSITTVYRQRRFAEMKNDFINNMTHEFKTPISTVSLACEALGDADVQKSEQLYDSYINIISDENKRLGIMAEKILQTAVIDKGELRLKKEDIDLHEIILDVIRNIRIQVEIKDGSILTELEAGSASMKADRVHMSNVIYNLLDNANKYTPRKPSIVVRTEQVQRLIKVTIEDNGIGISKADQKKVFDRLYRVPTGDVHDFKGFGLGLSYVKAIVEKHGGRVGVDSELEKGSKFWFILPIT